MHGVPTVGDISRYGLSIQAPVVTNPVRLPDRRSPRLPVFDYWAVAVYFVTICTHERHCVFGSVDGSEMALSSLGLTAKHEWLQTLELRPYVEGDAFVIMPNHVHLLFGLGTGDDVGRDPGSCRDTMHGVPTSDDVPLTAPRRFGNHGAHSVSSIVGTYKAAVTRPARRSGAWGDGPLWQGRFHDRVVRDERERKAIREYITDNPRQWQQDRFFQ
ncbi:transposase [soil metagenome]